MASTLRQSVRDLRPRQGRPVSRREVLLVARFFFISRSPHRYDPDGGPTPGPDHGDIPAFQYTGTEPALFRWDGPTVPSATAGRRTSAVHRRNRCRVRPERAAAWLHPTRS